MKTLKTIAIALLATVTVPVLANVISNTGIAQSVQPTVSFIGAEGNNAIFSVGLEDAAPVKFRLTLTDAEGNNIYSSEFETSNFSKVFKVVKNDNSSMPFSLSFHFDVETTGEKHDFEVSTVSETSKEVKITKL